MYEKFTDRARKVMQLANQEAQRFNHEYIGTEHILLGLIKEGSGVAANVLKNLGVNLGRIRLEVEKLVRSGPDVVAMGKLPQTPRAKKVIEYSMEEAQDIGDNHVGTEHILLGLLREEEGVAAIVLLNLGLKVDKVRQEVFNLVGHTPDRRKTDMSRQQNAFQISLAEWLVMLDALEGSLVIADTTNTLFRYAMVTRQAVAKSMAERPGACDVGVMVAAEVKEE